MVAFHSIAFILGHAFARRTVAHDSEPLARCISLETGMQVRGAFQKAFVPEECAH